MVQDIFLVYQKILLQNCSLFSEGKRPEITMTVALDPYGCIPKAMLVLEIQILLLFQD